MLQPYLYGGLAALIAGLTLATVVFVRRTFSNLIAGVTFALAVPLAALATALVSGQPASAIVPVVVYSSTILYSSTIQCLPAVLAALLCRKLLVSWHLISVAEGQKR